MSALRDDLDGHEYEDPEIIIARKLHPVCGKVDYNDFDSDTHQIETSNSKNDQVKVHCSLITKFKKMFTWLFH